MTQKAGTPPDGGAARLLIGLPLGLLIALAIASMIGWLILGLPVAAYDPLKMPQFVWYYRGDARVVRAMAGGLIGGGLLLGGLIYALWARGARSEEHTSELQSLMRTSYAVFCLKKKKKIQLINKSTGLSLNI